MHITERLGLDSGRPVTTYEGELLSAFEKIFIEEDLLFLRWGPSITLHSDAGNAIATVPRADRFSAEVMLAIVPSSAPAPTQVKNAIAFSSGVQESELKLVVIEQPGEPLMITCRSELQRPYTRDSLWGIVSEFYMNTGMALGEAMLGAGGTDEVDEAVDLESQFSSLRF